jgi:nuclear GTP-binding protein
MVTKKRLSKRLTLKDKYKIKGKIRDHNRKQRKVAKQDEKSGATARRALRKDPGIPNLWPFKDELLRQIEQRKAREEDRKVRRAEELRNLRSGPSAEQLEAAALGKRTRGQEEQGEAEEGQGAGDAGAPAQKRHAAGTLRAIVEDADVVLQVLDARDPEGSRSREVEDLVAAKSKKLVFVLNKTDLVPEHAAKAWLRALRAEHPCVLFRASTQKQKHNLKRAVGADDLVRLLKNYARDAGGGKQSIVVGVVGPPNVGKSSLVNSLKMRRAVGTSAQAGSTKSAQHVQIDQKLMLIDTPGVAAVSSGSGSKAVAALRQMLAPVGRAMDDPLACVEELVAVCPPERFMEEYGLPRFASPREFIVALAKQTGRLGKGGVLDLEAAARLVVNDCHRGKLRLFVSPPVPSVHDDADLKADAVVLSALTEEFEFDDEAGVGL